MNLPKLHVTVSGRMSWEMVSRSGLVVARGETKNLVLDSGLNHMAQYGIVNNGVNGNGFQEGPTKYAAVGTGSTAPANSQTALVAELAYTNSSPSGTGVSLTAVSPGVYDNVVTKEFDFNQANGNLTEWGWRPLATGTLYSRGLFRDGGGNPVVVTKTSDYKLRLTYTVRIRTGLPTVATAFTLPVANVGDRAGQWIGTTVGKRSGWGDDTSMDLSLFNSLLRGVVNLTWTTADVGALSATTGFFVSDAPQFASPAYVAGSFQRQYGEAVFTSSMANSTINALAYFVDTYRGNGGYYTGGAVFKFNAGQGITKTNLYQLKITGPLVTWGRE